MTNLEWLAGQKCNSLVLSYNDCAANYETPREQINREPEHFDDVPHEDMKAIMESGCMWTLQIYPTSPVCFHIWHAATLDRVIELARTTPSVL